MQQPEMLSEKVKAKCEGLFPVGQSTSMYLSVTGEPYVELCGLGTHVEGEADGRGYSSENDARDAAIEAFIAYADGKSGTLYWRVTPEIVSRNPIYFAEDGSVAKTGPCGFSFYMRCLISDKPVLAKDHESVRSYYESMSRGALGKDQIKLGVA